MKSEATSGAGSLKYSFDNITYTDFIPTATPFNDPLWYGAWSTTYVDVVKPLDLLVQGDIYFEIEASSDALYNEKFSFTWDYTIPPLTGLTMNKSSTSIVRTYSEQLSVTPNPEGASSSVTWSTSNASVATVSADGLVTGVDGGDAIITATSTVNTSIKTTCQVTVTPHLPGYKKITNDSELRFGATYTFAKFDTLDAAKFDDSLTYIPQYSATASPSGGMSVEGQALRLVLEPSSTPYLYSFRVVGTNKYLSGATDLINHIHFAENKGTPQTTLKVSRDDIGTEAHNDSQYFLRHDPSKPGFGYFESEQITGTVQISIYVDLTTVNSINEATTFANEVMYGFGYEAEHICETRLEILQGAYDMMTSSGKNEFDTNTDELFANARARLAYMETWVTLNSGSPLSIANNTNTTIFALVVISVLGVSVTFAYFYLNKKKKYN